METRDKCLTVRRESIASKYEALPPLTDRQMSCTFPGFLT